MPTKDELKSHLAQHVAETVRLVNDALRSKGLDKLRPVLERIGKGAKLPHWFDELRATGTLPNKDGKTIGSVIEMILVAVLEMHTFKGMSIPPLKINPARGVDIPDLDLGVKSPSENFCTSEPFFSAYERLLGSSHDILVLLTNYQDEKEKKNEALRVQIIASKYLRATQIADESLCKIAKKHRKWIVKEDVGRAQRFFRFLAYVNQSDWRAGQLLRMIAIMNDSRAVIDLLDAAKKDFTTKNKLKMKQGKIPIADSDADALERVRKVNPIHVGLLDACDGWLTETRRETARAPSNHEWKELLASPLEGVIGVSLALQWRYNFGRLFGMADADTCANGDQS